MLSNKKILLGISGSIAATKCVILVEQLLAKKAKLQIVLTEAAEHFVSYECLKQALNSNDIYRSNELFNQENAMLHIELARYPDIILIAPASANFIATLSGGFAHDLLSAICIASASKIFIAPAMNQQMWHNSFTQNNLNKLKQHDIEIIGPAEGLQACGDYGYGRMLEPEQIIENLEQFGTFSNSLANKKVVITAGPTIERIDAVRYISNFSSGKMGYALALAAKQLGAKVILVSGPTNLPKPTNIQVEYVESAFDMLSKTLDHVDQADIFISCAAVADYTPSVTYQHKLKKQPENLNLELKPNVDIVKKVATLTKKPFVVGVAAETNDLLANARKKLINKNLDMIVANDVSDGKVFGSDFNEVYIIAKHYQQPIYIPNQSKQEIANIILQHIAQEVKKIAKK